MTLTEKIAKLPVGWSMWQTFDKRIVIQIVRPRAALSEVQAKYASVTSSGDFRATIDADTIEAAVDKAITYTFPISLDRRPDDFHAAQWTPIKNNSGWSAKRTNGDLLGCCFKTKKELLEGLGRFAANAMKRQLDWDAAFFEMFPNGAIEGRDYVYS